MTVLRRNSPVSRAIGILILIAVPGCGDGKPSVDTSLNEATVTGIVSVKGEPVTAGTIAFNPANSGRIVATRTAEIGPEGRYTIKTYTGDNQVTFGGEVAKKHKGLGLMRNYADVKPGENQIDFDLMGAGSKVGGIDFEKKAQGRKR